MVPGCFAGLPSKRKLSPSLSLGSSVARKRPQYQTLASSPSVFRAFHAHSEVGQYETSL
jgi:hypothetical protein